MFGGFIDVMWMVYSLVVSVRPRVQILRLALEAGDQILVKKGVMTGKIASNL